MRLEAATKEDVRTIGSRLQAVEKRLDTTEIRIEKLEFLAQNPQQMPECKDEELCKQVQKLEEKLNGSATGTKIGPENIRTAVIGGLSGLSGEAQASQWIRDKMQSLQGPTVEESYIKGDFKRLLFAR